MFHQDVCSPMETLVVDLLAFGWPIAAAAGIAVAATDLEIDSLFVTLTLPD